MKKYVLALLIFAVFVLAATGDYNDPATASGTNWTSPTNVFLDDGSRATFSNTSQNNLFVTNFTIGAASSSIIDSIVVRINGHSTSGPVDNRKIEVALTKNGTSEVGDVVTIILNQDTDADHILTGSTDGLWGTTWTPAEINATTFGVTINKFNSNGNQLRIDHVQIKVWWTTPITISGTVYTDEGVTNAGSGNTVRLIVNGVDLGNDVTDAGGAYSISAIVNSGDAMLIYIDEETIDATTVTVSDGADLSGFNLYADHVITRHDNGGTLSNGDMNTAKGAFVDSEIEYSVTAGVLTVTAGNELYVLAGHTFAPAGNVSAGDVEILGTVTAASETFTVTGNWDAATGTFTPGTSTVKFTSSAGTFTPGTSSYNNVTLELTNNSTILTLGSNLDVNNNLTITTGDLDVSATNYNITVGGDFSNSGVFTSRSGTVTFDGTASNTFTAGTSSFYDVIVDFVSGTQILTLASDLDVNNNLTITTGDLDVSATNYNITIGGDFSRVGLFTPRNGTVIFDGTNQSIFGSTTFYNLTKSVASVDTLTFQVGTTQTFDGTVTLNGASGNLLSLVSSSPGSQWSFTVNAGATKTISYVDVEDSDALNSDITQRTINPSNSVDGGNNIEWFPTALGVSITNSTFSFGTVLASTWLTAQSSIVKNSGQSVADMVGKISQFTTGADNWDISATTNGADSVRSQWSITSSTGPWTDISAYDSDFTIVSTLAVDGTVTLWFRIETPTTTTSNSQYSSTLTVTAQ